MAITILKEIKSTKRKTKVECRCDCGRIFKARKDNVKSGITKSCGCFKSKSVRKVLDAYVVTHGMSRTPEWWSYSGAKQRCSNPKHISYKNYGGRGIKFLFKSFEDFYKELGPRPKNKTLDRIDNNGHYEPGNVRWATKKDQILNRRLAQCQ